VTTPALRLPVERLTRAAFAPYGDVIDTASVEPVSMNDGMGARYPALAHVDADAAGGKPVIGIVVAKPWPTPVQLALMERHPLSSQAFIPLDGRPFLVIVAPAGELPPPEHWRAFVTDGTQGISYRRGTWHHPLLALDVETRFLVVDRQAGDVNCDIVRIAAPGVTVGALPATAPDAREVAP
jgi:ureidoglycolate lyase